MTIPRLTPSVEKPFRDALGHAIRNEIDDMEQGLLRLTDEQIAFCLTMCLHVSGYVAIDVCGRRWPDEVDLNQIAEATTKSNNARAFGLKAEDSYAYVKRVVLRGEPLDAVLPPAEHGATLSFVVTGHLLLSFHPAEEHWWEYLNRIEDALAAAQAIDLDMLPALMLRARRPASPADPQRPSGTDAVSS